MIKVTRQPDETITLTMEAKPDEWEKLLEAINAVGRKSPEQKQRIGDFTAAVLKEGEGYLEYTPPPPRPPRNETE